MLVLEDLRELVEVESPSSDPAGLRACAETLDGILERRLGRRGTVGDDARVTWTHEPADAQVPPILILGHLDTVWPLGTLARIPFSVDDGTVRGPGTFDMKSGLVVAIHAMATLLARDALPPVRMLVTSDEEVGSDRSRTEIEAQARACRRVLVLEPCGPGGAVKTARKGVALGRLTARGRASHAGLDPDEGINAVVGLGAVLPRVAALGDPDTGTTVTPTLVRGGSAVNTVPAEASVDLDVRFLDDREVERVRRAIDRLDTPNGAELSLDLVTNRPALNASASAPLVPALRAAAAEAGIDLRTVTVGGASDGNLAAAAGAAVLDGLGPDGGGAHADHEHVTVPGIVRRIALLEHLIPHVSMVEVPAAG